MSKENAEASLVLKRSDGRKEKSTLSNVSSKAMQQAGSRKLQKNW